MRNRLSQSFALVCALAFSSAADADERLTVRVDFGAHVSVSEFRLAEQAGEDSLGNDLGRVTFGPALAIGIDTGQVAVLAFGSIEGGGLDGEAVAEHYFPDPQANTTAFSFTVGAAARYRRPAKSRLAPIADLRLGYSRMQLESDGASANITSLSMELAGGIEIESRWRGVDTAFAATLGVRAHRPSSFAATGLTEGKLDPEEPGLLYQPGLSVSYAVLF